MLLPVLHLIIPLQIHAKYRIYIKKRRDIITMYHNYLQIHGEILPHYYSHRTPHITWGHMLLEIDSFSIFVVPPIFAWLSQTSHGVFNNRMCINVAGMSNFSTFHMVSGRTFNNAHCQFDLIELYKLCRSRDLSRSVLSPSPWLRICNVGHVHFSDKSVIWFCCGASGCDTSDISQHAALFSDWSTVTGL